MIDLDELRRTHSRVAGFRDFHPNERIWWVYMRNAAIEVASRGDFPDLKALCDTMAAFPEHLPNERAHWLKLRAAVARVVANPQ
ncbi:MAG: hypothetical protein ACKO01_02955 [Erythrobacter sp.]